jgi:hypothetical protein
MATMRNLFDRLGKPQPTTKEVVKTEKIQPIEKLLNWLVNKWTEDEITLHQLRVYGPGPLRNDPKTIVYLAQSLVARGWLIPLKPERRDMLKWKIGHKTNRLQA